MTLPTRLRSQVGISEGDLVEAAFHRGKIVLTPKVLGTLQWSGSRTFRLPMEA